MVIEVFEVTHSSRELIFDVEMDELPEDFNFDEFAEELGGDFAHVRQEEI